MRFFNVSNTVRSAERRRAVAALVAACAALTAGATAAQPVADGYLVRFADLDTRTPAGAGALLQRIEFAADHVCGAGASIISLTNRHYHKVCRQVAVGRAVEKVDAPMLTALAQRSNETVAESRGQ